jgi:transposase
MRGQDEQQLDVYSVRSERLLIEQLDYSLLFRWFVSLNVDDSVWDVTVFTKNRDVAKGLFQAVLRQAAERSLLSNERFTVVRMRNLAIQARC